MKLKAVSQRSAKAVAASTRLRQKSQAKLASIKATIATRVERTPRQVISSFLQRAALPSEQAYLSAGAATLIIRTDLPSEPAFKKSLAKVLGVTLSAASVNVTRMALANAAITAYSVSFSIAHHRVRTEILNLAWAIRQAKVFHSVGVSGLQAQLFELKPTAATHAERVFSHHLELTRFSRAHLLPPTATGRALGAGITIAVVDVGWAPHAQFNVAQIDVANSRNAITRARGGTAARHSIRNGDADSPNITHGTAVGSVILGGVPNDGQELSSTEPDSALQFDTTIIGDRRYVSGDVRDSRGHLTGAAPQATVLPIKFVSDTAGAEILSRGFSGHGVFRLFDRDLIQGIRDAIDGNAHVITMSVGGLMHDDVREIIDEAVTEHGIIVVAAAGQTYAVNVVSGVAEGLSRLGIGADDSVVLPAAYSNVIAVAGCTPSGAPWAETHRGPNIDITAPADAIWIADFLPKDNRSAAATRGETLECASGTSFAAPLVASAAALWLAHHGRQTLINRYQNAGKPIAWAFRHVMVRTARALPDWDDGRYGPGIIDVEALLRAPLPRADQVEAPPEMVGALIPWISGGASALNDAFVDLLGWVGEQVDGAAQQAALLWAAGEKAAEDAKDGLIETWAKLDAGARQVTGTVLAELDRAKQGIVAVLEEQVANAEDALEEFGDTMEDMAETAGEAVENFSDSVGEAASDALDAAGEFLSFKW